MEKRTEKAHVLKYTHAQAVEDGELRQIDFCHPSVTLYISPDADKALKDIDADPVIRDNCLSGAVALALICDDIPNIWVGRSRSQSGGVEYEIDRNFEIRDDNKRKPCCTIVLPGER